MNIIINGEEKNINTALNIAEMLSEQGYGEMTIAVARNGSFVPKDQHISTQLEEGDQIEIVAPMQGG